MFIHCPINEIAADTEQCARCSGLDIAKNLVYLKIGYCFIFYIVWYLFIVLCSSYKKYLSSHQIDSYQFHNIAFAELREIRAVPPHIQYVSERSGSDNDSGINFYCGSSNNLSGGSVTRSAHARIARLPDNPGRFACIWRVICRVNCEMKQFWPTVSQSIGVCQKKIIVINWTTCIIKMHKYTYAMFIIVSNSK